MSEHEGWVQDPDGNWHQKQRPRISPVGWLVILVVVASLVAGGFYVNWKADQDRVNGESDSLSCQIMGSC